MSTFCTYYDRNLCRSCTWLEVEYPTQLGRKEERVLRSLGFFPELKLEKTIESKTQSFRNRAKMAVSGTLEEPVIGLLGQELLHCPIHHPKLNELMSLLPDFIRLARLTPYQIESRTGELKGLICYYSPLAQTLYLRFVLRSQDGVARIRKHLALLQNQFPALKCVSANIQPIPHAILEGPTEIFLTPDQTIAHCIESSSGTVRLKLAPQAFVQTHFELSTLLYQTASRWIGESTAGRVLDLFCGQGAFSFLSAHQARQFLGIEINPAAVHTANDTARELGWSHLHFQASDASKVSEEIEKFKPDLILVNPPRRGLADSVSLIQAYLPRHLIYSSCDIDTMSHDLKLLSPRYRLKRAQIFDLFPHTEHFETLAWLERKS